VHRLLAKVVAVEAGGRRAGPGGLRYGSYRLRVRIEGSAVGALEAPPSVVGRLRTVRRSCLLPWEPKRGDLLVLDPAESARVLAPRRSKAPRSLGRPGTAGVRRADADGDGWEEDVFSNCFVSGVVQEHRGARLLSLTGRDGRDRLSQPGAHIMSGDYVLLGGVEESVFEAGVPGDLWKARFSRQQSPAGAAVTYERKLKSPEGVTLTKRISVEPDLPGVVEVVRLSRAAKPDGARGAERDEADGEPSGEGSGETDLSPLFRMTVPVLGDVGALTVFDIPAHDGLSTVRFHRPPHGRRWRWREWKDESFGIRPGFLVSRNEREGNILAWLFAADRSPVVSVRSDFEGPEVSLRYAPAAVEPGGRAEFGSTFLVGDAAAVSGTSLLLVTAGRRVGSLVPVAITLRTSRRAARPRAALATPAGRRSVTLARTTLPGAGCVHSAVVRMSRASFPVRCSVTLGAERLSCVLEA
jgi:hypothetical protein